MGRLFLRTFHPVDRTTTQQRFDGGKGEGTTMEMATVTPLQQHQQFDSDMGEDGLPIDPAASSSGSDDDDMHMMLPMTTATDKAGFSSPPAAKLTRSHSLRLNPRFQVSAISKNKLTKVYWNPIDWCLGTAKGQGTVMLIIALILVMIGSVAWGGTPGNEDYDQSYGQGLWLSWGLFFDPGTQTGLAATDPIECKLVAAVFSVLGFMFNMVVLGTVVDVVRERIDYYEKLRSRVVANGHTLVLGWSDKTLFLLQELCKSMENTGGGEIVLLVHWDEFEVRQDISLAIPDLLGSTIVVRQGDPTESCELDRVSIISASTVIVLGGSGKPVASDQHVLRVVLSAMALDDEVSGRMLCEIRIPENLPVVDDMLSGCGVGFVTRDVVMRVLCMSALCPAVGETYIDAMSFADGEELYLNTHSELAGVMFDHVTPLFPAAVVLGIWSPGTLDGTLLLPPAPGYELKAEDHLLMLALDSSDTTTDQSRILSFVQAKAPSKRPGVDPSAIAQTKARRLTNPQPTVTVPELSVAQMQLLSNRTQQGRSKVVIIGWAADIPDLLHTLNSCVTTPSEVCILSDKVERKRQYVLQQAAIGLDGTGLDMLTLTHYYGGTTNSARISELPLIEANCVIILADDLDEDESPMVSDSANLTSTVLVNKYLTEHQDLRVSPSGVRKAPCTIICELLDNRTERILQKNQTLSRKGHFFHSNLLETGMFATAAKEPIIAHALGTLLQPHSGPVIVTVGIEAYYQELDIAVSFDDLAERVRVRGEVLLGWREDGLAHEDGSPLAKVELNPKQKDQPKSFTSADDLIILRPNNSPFDLRASKCQ